MSRRWRMHDVDPATWPAFDAGALPEVQREVFAARRRAVELYASGCALRQIEIRTQVLRGNLYRMLERCFAPDEDGRPQGWKALTPYAHVSVYRRIACVTIPADGTGRGAVGAFGLLLQTQPKLAAWIAEQVRDKRFALEQRSTDDGLRTRLRGLKHLHSNFLRECRALGLNAAHYPFTAKQLGIRSLSTALRAECLRSFGGSAGLAGAHRLKGLPRESSVPAASRRWTSSSSTATVWMFGSRWSCATR